MRPGAGAIPSGSANPDRVTRCKSFRSWKSRIGQAMVASDDCIGHLRGDPAARDAPIWRFLEFQIPKDLARSSELKLDAAGPMLAESILVCAPVGSIFTSLTHRR